MRGPGLECERVGQRMCERSARLGEGEPGLERREAECSAYWKLRITS